MGMMKEFKEFAVKGNMIDMAVGIIIGAAFGKIVSSLVADVIMPPLGLLMGKVDFSQLFLNLGDGEFKTIKEAEAAGAPILKWGSFLQTVLDFVIVAFAIFLMVKAINSAKKKEEAKPTEPSKEVKLLTEIRDALQK